MSLNFIRKFFVKRILLNRRLSNDSVASLKSIRTIGIIVDETNFLQKNVLLEELTFKGFSLNSIEIISYNENFSSKNKSSKSVFGDDELSWNGKINDSSINYFINKEFDLLISYYTIERDILLVMTSKSRAKFKVGLSILDAKLNHLMINTEIENSKVFVHELYKYLILLGIIKKEK